METFNTIIAHPFTWGLIIGLVLMVLTWKSGLTTKKYLNNEIKRVKSENDELQTHLSTQLKINAKGNETLQKQLDDVTKQNENLRINIQQLQQKPDKAEHRRLEVVEMAITSMRENAPGFAPAWENCVRQAEHSVENAEAGFTKLLNKFVPSFKSSPKNNTSDDTKFIETNSSKHSE